MEEKERRNAGDRERDRKAQKSLSGASQRQLRDGKGWPFSGGGGEDHAELDGSGMYMLPEVTI
jgi:hypothetical protein